MKTKILARINKDVEVVIQNETFHFKRGQEVELDLDVFKKLLDQGIAVPGGFQHGKPVRMNE